MEIIVGLIFGLFIGFILSYLANRPTQLDVLLKQDEKLRNHHYEKSNNRNDGWVKKHHSDLFGKRVQYLKNKNNDRTTNLR